MIELAHAAETTRTSPDTQTFTPEGSPTVIILERDGSLRHYPPGRSDEEHSHARVQLDEDQAHQSIIDKILDFSFDLLGVSNLEVRVNEHPKR
jgi:hypothetical protein